MQEDLCLGTHRHEVDWAELLLCSAELHFEVLVYFFCRLEMGFSFSQFRGPFAGLTSYLGRFVSASLGLYSGCCREAAEAYMAM